MSLTAEQGTVFPGFSFYWLSGWWTIAQIILFLFHPPQVQTTSGSLRSVSSQMVSLLLSQWVTLYHVAAIDRQSCFPEDLVKLRKLCRLTTKWIKNQEFFKWQFAIHNYIKTTILITVYHERKWHHTAYNLSDLSLKETLKFNLFLFHFNLNSCMRVC